MTKTSSTVSLEAVIMAFCFIPNFKEPTHVFTIKCDSSCRFLVDTPKLSKEVPVYSSFPKTFIKSIESYKNTFFYILWKAYAFLFYLLMQKITLINIFNIDSSLCYWD